MRGMTYVFRYIRDYLRANFTPNFAPGRALSNAAGTTNIFQPNLARPVLVTYSVRMTLPVSAAVQDGAVFLEIAPTSPPTNVAGRGEYGMDVAGILSTIEGRSTWSLTALVPKGWYVRIRPQIVSGTPTFTLLDQVESAL